MNEDTKSKLLYMFLGILIALVLFFVGNKLYNYYFDKGPVIMTEEQVKDPKYVKDEINKNSNSHITDSQSREIVKQIEYIAVENKQPEYVVQTTREKLDEVSKAEQKKHDADAAIIAPSNDNKYSFDIDKLPANTPVNLNQYNIKAYPKHLLSMTAMSDKSASISYQTKVKIFGATGYIGPAVSYNGESKKGAVGLSVTIPLD